MSSIYNRKGNIYISYYDRATGKTKSKTLGLKYNKTNIYKAKKIQKQFDKKLEENYEKLKRSGAMYKTTIGEAINKFMRVNKFTKAENTLSGYKNFFDKFLGGFFSVEDPVSIINKRNVENWIMSIDKSRYKQNTLYGITKNLKKFLKFLFEDNYILTFRLNSDLVFKPEVGEIIVFTKEDTKILFNNLGQKSRNFRRMFYLLYYTGLRPTDIINIKKSDIDMENSMLRYYSIKTKNYFEVPLPNELVNKLAPLLADLGNNDKVIQYSNLHNMGRAFREYMQQIGLQGKYNLRTFRKSYISLAYNSDVELATVANLVGHKDIRTTSKYYARLSIHKKREELSKIKFNNYEGNNDDI